MLVTLLIRTLLGTYDTPGNACGVQVIGNMAYVADHREGLQILDISNLATRYLSAILTLFLQRRYR